MKRDFPPEELPPFPAIKRNLKNGGYECFFLNASGIDVGYAIVTAPTGYNYALLQFFAVFPEKRSQGYGGSFIKLICERYYERSMVLEVDDPAAAKSKEAREVALKRIIFYEKAGFGVIPASRVKIWGVDMLIMTNSKLRPQSVRQLMHNLYLPTFLSEEWLRFIDVAD